MVERIASQLERLEPHRFLAVITYTQAATEEIRNRLNSKCNIPPNVFIGTIHSFLNRFIFTPFGSILGIVPFEKTFIESVVLSYTPKISYMGPHLKNKIAERLLPDGLVTYDKIIEKSQDLISKDRILKVVANRIQMLFIDEYQDATQVQHKIFNTLLKFGKTQLYCVGDPEQYIMGFTYRLRGEKTPDYKTIPIMDFKSVTPPEYNKLNKRSTPKIVNFVNRFNSNSSQESDRKHEIDLDVHFISDVQLSNILNKFEELCINLRVHEVTSPTKRRKLALSYENNTLDPLNQTRDTTFISNDELNPRGLLKETVRYVCSVVGLTQRKLCETKNITLIDLRKYALQIFKKIKNDLTINDHTLRNIIAGQLNISENSKTNTDDTFKKLRRYIRSSHEVKNQCSTIHKAKGLEAQAVLVVASKGSELRKWLETDAIERSNDKLDQCRIGYVAFSRAGDFLCLACLEPIDASMRKMLSDFNVVVV